MSDDRKKGGLIAELNRRNVIRVTIAYVLVAWVLLQIADVLFPALTLPDWTIRFVAGLLILGFPLVVFFAWTFELTSEGLKREHEVPRDQSITHETGRKLNVTMVVIATIAIGVFALDRLVWRAEEPADMATAPIDRSIAVLPFVNMSDDPANEYFSDGMSEELLNLLAKVPELRVIGRTSSFQFKGKHEDLRVIGEKLGVANILEGSVRKSGNTVRVTAQLISADDGAHLWSESFDRSLDDIFKVQDEIALSVVETLKVKLLGARVSQRITPQNREAYDLYLNGRYFYEQLGNQPLEKAKDYFGRALELDPGLGLAWDALGAVYVREIINGQLTTEKGRPMALEALNRGLELDPTLASAHYRIGTIKMIFDWDMPGAEASYRRALEVEPNSAEVLSGLGLILMALGRSEEAIDFQRRSLEIDPLRSASYHNLGFIALHAGDFELAERHFRKALEMNAGYPRGSYYVSLALLVQGRFQQAHAEIQNETAEHYRLAGIALTCHALGRADESDAAIRELAGKFSDKGAFLLAEAHAYRGENDQAFQWLDRALAQREPVVPWMRSSPLLERLRSDPRFEQMAQRLNAKT